MSSSAVAVAETIAILVVAGVGLGWLARRLAIPEPVLLLGGGAALSYAPGLETVSLDPELVLLVFVAPLLYTDGFFAPIRELRRNAVSIGLLASVLVVATAAGVALVAHYVSDLPWAMAFALGGALSATDALAPAQVLDSEAAEPRLVAVVRGESLFNDGIAFTLVSVAGAAAASQTFHAGAAGLELATAILGGVAMGLLVAWLVGHLRRRTREITLEAGISLLTPFLAYMAAELIHGSGILAAVAAGLWVGHHSYGYVDPLARLEIQSAWRVISFMLNTLLFLLVGLQAREIVSAVSQPAGRVLLGGLAVTLAVVGLRLAWALTVAPVWRGAASRISSSVNPPSSRAWRLALGWSGVRGSVALAAALAIPMHLDDGGGRLAGRDLVIVLTLFVIFATVLLQGLTLRPLVRRLGLTDPAALAEEEQLATHTASHVALAALPEVADRHGLDADERHWIEREYELRNLQSHGGPDQRAEAVLEAASQTDLELLSTARDAVLELEERGEVRSEVAQEVIRRLDLSSARQRA